MTKEQEEKVKNNLLNVYEHHLGNALRNIMRKSSLDVKNDLVTILESDDKDLIRDAKVYLEDTTDILFNDLNEDLKKFLKEYHK